MSVCIGLNQLIPIDASVRFLNPLPRDYQYVNLLVYLSLLRHL